MQLDLFSRLRADIALLEDWIIASGRRLPLQVVRNPRARRYILRLNRHGIPRVTIPRGGSKAEAKSFAQKHSSWVEKQLLRQQTRQKLLKEWTWGMKVQFRGEAVELEKSGSGNFEQVRFGDQLVTVAAGTIDLRPAIERHLWHLATKEFPARVLELARLHGLSVKRVTVRNQRSRWGSCSRRGTISLNWRLIQTPVFVRDYVILHELAHLRQMNHSARFWREVAWLCPDVEAAEAWLKRHSKEFGL